MSGYNLICCVVNIGDATKIMKHVKEYGVVGETISIGRGTVNNRILEFLMLTETRKEIVTMIIDSSLASKALKRISDDMAFDKPHHGIAFSYSVAEFVCCENMTGHNMNNSGGKNSMYKAIYVVVNKGNAEGVIDAAKKGGARGGTIMNARGSGIHESQKLFSIEIVPEKEKVLIITKTDLKDAIIASIRNHLTESELGNGIIYVLDVDEVYGLHDGH